LIIELDIDHFLDIYFISESFNFEINLKWKNRLIIKQEVSERWNSAALEKRIN
jgi:hypothetical protein